MSERRSNYSTAPVSPPPYPLAWKSRGDLTHTLHPHLSRSHALTFSRSHDSTPCPHTSYCLTISLSYNYRKFHNFNPEYNKNRLYVRTVLHLCIILLSIILSPHMLSAQTTPASFDLQGHRGCRGLMPENTLPGFIRAIELGVTTLEMDVVVAGDGMIVVSHEPWMSADICTQPGGKLITRDNEKSFNLYKMDYAAIQGFDCGMKVNPKFPDQKKMPVVKPSLKMAVRMIRSFAEDNKHPQPRYNIEIKSDPKDYNIYQPEPAKFVELVVTEIKRLGIEDITTLQSFDPKVLEELNKVPEHKYKIAYLVESGKKLKKNLDLLTFKPDIYSPEYNLVNEQTVADCHAMGIKIIPWTINNIVDMDRLKAWGIDGGITDFPDVVR